MHLNQHRTPYMKNHRRQKREARRKVLLHVLFLLAVMIFVFLYR